MIGLPSQAAAKALQDSIAAVQEAAADSQPCSGIAAPNRENMGKIPKSLKWGKTIFLLLDGSMVETDAWNVFVCILEDFKHFDLSRKTTTSGILAVISNLFIINSDIYL